MRFQRLAESLLQQPPDCGVTLALLIQRDGETVFERYGPETTAETTLISWSMAKSITHALVGILIKASRLELDQPAPIREWQHDDRRHITIRHLLGMTDGLGFVEDYVDAGVSDVIEMLFGIGSQDVAGYAIGKPLVHTPGTVFNYSSGTSNIVARIVGDTVGGGADGMRAFLHRELFEPLAMTSATPRFDAAGTFVGSSYVFATARDFARFGELYREHGRDLLPAGWVEHAGTPVAAAVPAEERFGYGGHWWLWDRMGLAGVFGAHGYEGQRIVVDQNRRLTLVRLGKTDATSGANLDARLREILAAFD